MHIEKGKANVILNFPIKISENVSKIATFQKSPEKLKRILAVFRRM